MDALILTVIICAVFLAVVGSIGSILDFLVARKNKK